MSRQPARGREREEGGGNAREIDAWRKCEIAPQPDSHCYSPTIIVGTEQEGRNGREVKKEKKGVTSILLLLARK